MTWSHESVTLECVVSSVDTLDLVTMQSDDIAE